MPGESCRECAYLVGHSATCSKARQDPETNGWNAGLEAAAKEMEQEAEDCRRAKDFVLAGGNLAASLEEKARDAGVRAARIRHLKK